jgi:hypothetical protein
LRGSIIAAALTILASGDVHSCLYIFHQREQPLTLERKTQVG